MESERLISLVEDIAPEKQEIKQEVKQEVKKPTFPTINIDEKLAKLIENARGVSKRFVANNFFDSSVWNGVPEYLLLALLTPTKEFTNKNTDDINLLKAHIANFKKKDTAALISMNTKLEKFNDDETLNKYVSPVFYISGKEERLPKSLTHNIHGKGGQVYEGMIQIFKDTIKKIIDKNNDRITQLTNDTKSIKTKLSKTKKEKETISKKLKTSESELVVTKEKLSLMDDELKATKDELDAFNEFIKTKNLDIPKLPESIKQSLRSMVEENVNRLIKIKEESEINSLTTQIDRLSEDMKGKENYESATAELIKMKNDILSGKASSEQIKKYSEILTKLRKDLHPSQIILILFSIFGSNILSILFTGLVTAGVTIAGFLLKNKLNSKDITELSKLNNFTDTSRNNIEEVRKNIRLTDSQIKKYLDKKLE